MQDVFSYSRNTGYTLIEIIVSVGILTLIGALSMASYVNSRKVRELTASAQNILSVLRLAQSKALGGEDNTPWGVRIETRQVTLFRGASYSTSTSTIVTALPSSIEIANINLAGGGSDIIFKRLTGHTDQSGAFDVRIAGDTAKAFPVTVGPSGKAFRTGTASTLAGTRILDTRHRTFNLGWSIKTATTLNLDFPDDSSNNAIPMATYFDAAKTAFDWSGTITVGGQQQVIRVHTLSLTDSNTILSIDRDCRKNTKKLRVSIDGKEIAIYEQNCQTITMGPFGGTMTEP